MIKEYKINIKHPFLCYDVVFKSVFTTFPNILAKLISDITNIPYSLLENNIYLETNELPISRDNEKAKKCDFIVRYNKESIINIELNHQSHTGLLIKNLAYICKIFSTNFDKGKKYNNNISVMQINIDAFKTPNKPALSKYTLREETTNDLYLDNIVIYSLNVVKCYNLYYNNINNQNIKYISWGALIYSKTFEEINNISKKLLTNEERTMFMEELDRISTSEFFRTAEESIRLAEWEKSMMLKDAKNEGLELGKSEGFEQGIEHEKTNTIKEMLKKNISLEDISDITGKTIEEIKEISKNN